MKISDHIYIIVQQLFQTLSQQQKSEKHFWKNIYYGTNRRAYKKKLEAIDRMTSNIILLLSVRIFNQDIIQQIEEFIGKKTNSTLHVKTMYQLHNIFQNYPKILLHSDMETIIINQWGRMNNTQVEDVLVIEATQYQALVSNNWLSKINTHMYIPATCGYFKSMTTLAPLINVEEEWNNKPCFACKETLLDKEIRAVRCLNECPHDNNEIWQIALTKIEGALPEKIKTIKNNPSESIELNWSLNSDIVLDSIDPKHFHKHYQELALIKEKQEQCLKQLNTQLCDHCLIPYDFQYCNKCDLIYNPLTYIIYTIFKEEKPISNCVSELELQFNPNLNSNNDDNENNSSSSVQNGNKNNNNLDSNSNPKQYIALFNLTKKQKLKWFSNNNKNIMLEHVHNTNIGFDLRYLEKKTIKLEPHSCTCIDLKVALKIPATMIAYIIEPNKKIAQAIFLFLVKIAQLVLDQAQIFKVETTICKLEKIGLTNLYIPPKSPKHIKILIYNITEDVIKIPKGTTIRYLSTEVEKQPPNFIPNFPQLCRDVDITLQTIYG
ncbi:hypothetical protein G9A89_021269 [Geosiphon pyriformis]|nr:hypothetical protein G9A89_021269 [Geosiphon pyriformis]